MRRLLARRGARDAEHVFVAEGATLLGEALDSGAVVESVYVAPGGDTAPEVGRAQGAGARVHHLAAGVMERIAATVTPQPVAAVVGMRSVALEDLSGSRPVVVCVDVRDPGNLGTVLRSAEAAGAAGVVCCDGTVDVFNPKSVRASAGALFHVPIVVGGDPVTVLETLGAGGRRRLGTVVHQGVPYDTADLATPLALVLGNEAAGLPDTVTPLLDGLVCIPMEGRTESLNVGMACAVLCFEAARQRRHVEAGRG
ncbi:MAG: TrmH family RNA methyltransferase [Acidimicrobiales bacterium]